LTFEPHPMQVRFDADEAVEELSRLGLLSSCSYSSSPSSSAPSFLSRGQPGAGQVEGRGGGAASAVVEVVPLVEATRVVQTHWDALLWHRVDGVLREFGSS
jgi:hypothetical protein